MCLMFLFLILLFGGYSLYSQGVFLFSRAWQGKAVLAVILLPALVYLLAEIYKSPHDKKSYRDILILSTAAVSLSPASVFLVPAAAVTAAICMLARWKQKRYLLNLAASIMPAIVAGLILIIFTKITSRLPAEGQPVDNPSYIGNFKSFFGNQWLFYLYISAAILVYFRRHGNATLKFLGVLFPLALLLSSLNPLLFKPLSSNITYDTYWRFLWLLPITIVIPLGAALAVKSIGGLFGRSIYYKWIAGGMAAGLIVLALISSGQFIYRSPLMSRDTSRGKLPPGVESASRWLSGKREGNVLASYGLATYMHNVTSKDTLVISRPEYLAVFYKTESTEFKDKNKLYKMLNGLSPPDAHTLNELLKKYRVRYLVLNADDKKGINIAENSGYLMVYKNTQYKIYTVYYD